MRKVIVGFIGIILSQVVYAQTTVVLTAPAGDGFVSDPAVIVSNNPFTELDLKIGKSAVDGSANLTSAIIPFELPAIPDGEEITDASLSVYVSFGREWIEDNCYVDLYGLDYQSSVAISSSDHYSGAFGTGNGSDTGIEDDYFQKNVPRGSQDTPRFEETSVSGNANLVSYIKAQYTAGAEAGDYVFLRLSIDLPEMTNSQYFGVHGGEGTNPATLSITHEPVVNVAPVLAAIGNQSVETSEDLTIALSASDVNGDALTFSVSNNLPPSAVFSDHGDNTGSITITNAGSIATYSDIIVTVSDGEFSDDETFDIDIIAQAPNVAPVLASVGDLEIDQYGYGKLDISASDADDDALTFSVSDNLPSSAVLVDNGDGTAHIEVISESVIADYSDIVITVSDGEDQDTESVSVSIVSRDANELMNLDEPSGNRFTITDQIWPSAHGEADVSYWNDDKVAVVTITIDDNIEADHSFWLGLQETYDNLKYTWFVIDNQVTSWANYQTLLDAGNEVNGHDDCDINSSVDETDTSNDQTYRTALESISDDISTNTTGEALTYAYPCGIEYDQHIARDIYIAMRGVHGEMNQANTINYLALNSRSASNDNADIDNILDETGAVQLFGTSYYRGWYSTHYHSVTSNGTLQANTESHMSYINDHADELWIAGFSEAALYGQERDSHNLTVDEVLDLSVKFTLTDDMKDEVFDYPLTVKIRVNNDWESASTLQNGVARQTSLISHEGNKYVLVKAIPDQGQAVVTGSTSDSENHAPVLAAIGDQTLSHVEEATITVMATDEDDDFLTFTVSEELPSFASLTDNNDGTATLEIIPTSSSDIGLVDNIIITVSDGQLEDLEEISIEITEFAGTIRYCDPENGSNSNDGSEANPWGSFATALATGKVIEDGDLIYLMDGDHGNPYISSKIFSEEVKVKSVNEHSAVFGGLVIANSKYWTFSDIKIDGSSSGLSKEGFLVTGDVNSTDLIFDNCLIQSAEESSTWTKADWYANAKGGMDMRGENVVVENTTIKNTYHAMSLRGDNSRATSNLIDNFAGDGVRGLGQFQTFEYNTIRDCYVEDYETNHDDAFQTYILTGDPKSEGLTLRYNKILLFEDPITQFVIDNDLIGESMQGIIVTDGYPDGWVVENNLLVTDHYHGISLYGARNSRIQNNTVIKHPYFSDDKIPWILIEDNSKTGQTNFNNIIRNNLATDISFDEFDETSTVEGNLQIGLNSSSDYNDYFEDYTGYNYLTKAESPAINVGVNTDLSDLDLAGNQRLANGTADAGAYEYYSSSLPVIESIGDVTMLEGETETINITATDPDDNVLTISGSNLPSFATLTDNGDGTASLELAPQEGSKGSYDEIRITADNGTLSVSELFNVEVSTDNTAPILVSIGAQETEEGVSKEISLSATDSEDDDLEFDLEDAPSFVSLLDNMDGTGSLNISAETGDVGTYTFSVLVSDGSLEDEEEITLTVSEAIEENTAPVLSAIGEQAVEEGITTEVFVSSTDAESDDLSFSLIDEPSFVSFSETTNGSGKLKIKPQIGDAGSYTFTLMVSDGSLSDEEKLTLTVNNQEVLFIQENIQNALTVYPNPTKSGIFFVKVKGHEVISIQLRDLSGRQMGGELQVSPSGTDVLRVQTSVPLLNQPYILTLQIGHQTINQLLIVN
ncbi:MAG: Ig-like domain-containing protein [Reichenbachiella sp.]|uniref:Ig-like domain-containing protein n=1 Tax=Reichenbachiella sp. TaxID=2184521 RepID=UPI003264A1BF